MSEITFYTNPMSRGRIARWMLEEVGAPYTEKVIQYGPDMKGTYLEINPMGKVPAIVHGEQVVTECAAICAYLADAFPDAGLAPAVDRRGAYYRWLFFAAGPVEQAVTNKSMQFTVADPQKQGMLGYGNFELTQDTLAKAVSGDGYVAGPEFTAADVYVGAQVSWGVQFGTMDKKPEFIAYAQRVTDRDAYRRATEKDDALVAAQA
ncbi:glutathione S-transferase family protein [Aquisalinus flavus]|uniref:Glutathione S-transferase n=1 Tax=Aquisalinus flavus TaxID=1526572 RepID=A0A8J2V414_9PROT|nr:glutathione S-transferase family protein [Aquisalinus flavus]MBD0425217.1 glutathione S-transferase family protein [Aquisalinus flavus]UNE49122.1 glutathione S-transferase family protein [Aquisalinus flavus]GGD17794.1 glutathione S-transferase [Aquisalinus flavus]